VLAHKRCQSNARLRTELARIEKLGGEGVMMRKAGSAYTHGRSHDLLKVKSFKDDEAHGQGTYSYSDGSVHEGWYAVHLRDGFGINKFANGNRFEGQYKAGVMVGEGTWVYKDGSSWEGSWIANTPSGLGKWRCVKGGYTVDGEGPSSSERGQIAAPAKWRTATEAVEAAVSAAVSAAAAAGGGASIFNGAVMSGLSLGSGGGLRLAPVTETSIKIMPTTKWEDMAPACGCADFLRSSAAVRTACPDIDTIAADCESKAEELRYEEDLPAALDVNQTVALAAYTHDLGAGQAGNLYFEANNALRKRDKAARTALVRGWGGYMHYVMGGLARLPKVACVCYRAFGNKAAIVAQYKMGRPIQWGAFSSTSTDFAAAKGFADKDNGVIFKINVTDGRDINAYSFFPQEAEVLLSPSHKFTVCSAPYARDGFTVIDLVQQEGSAFIS
jgi:hypothetical protein